MERVEKYRCLCDTETSIPLYSQAWWLDVVAGINNWDVVIIERDNDIIASMPYMISRNRGMIFIDQPKVTQFLGPWLKQSESKNATRLGLEMELMFKILDNFPKFDWFHQNWSPKMTNWLPFYWSGYSQTTKYTYRIPLNSDCDLIWKEFKTNIRGYVNKAKTKYNLKVRSDLPIEDFIILQKMTFERQKIAMPIPDELIKKLHVECTLRNSGKVMIAVDEMGRLHAGLYLVWDKSTAYYIMSGGDPDLRSSGAASFLLWEAIKFASTIVESFDFEGSMNQQIERFFRDFGGMQTPYFSISKINSRRLKIKIKFLELISCLK